MGDAYQNAVMSCLEANTDVTNDVKPRNTVIADFYTHVIQDLDIEEL